jgi:hypothetical protein
MRTCFLEIRKMLGFSDFEISDFSPIAQNIHLNPASAVGDPKREREEQPLRSEDDGLVSP